MSVLRPVVAGLRFFAADARTLGLRGSIPDGDCQVSLVVFLIFDHHFAADRFAKTTSQPPTPTPENSLKFAWRYVNGVSKFRAIVLAGICRVTPG